MAMDRAPKAKGGTGVFGSVDDLPPFLSAENLKPFISDRLRQSTTPIVFRSKSGVSAMGFDARLLPMVCDVYVQAGLARKLTKPQMKIADACRRIQAAFSEMGIVSLVDQASGFADDQARDELSRLLSAYVAPELAPWTQKFPHEFFRQVYRLHGWHYQPGVTKGPRYIGKFINKYVWGGLPAGVVEEIKNRNPSNERGQRQKKMFQFLTDETGIPHLDWQISTVTTLMRAAVDKLQFDELHARAFKLTSETQLRLQIDEGKKSIDA